MERENDVGVWTDASVSDGIRCESWQIKESREKISLNLAPVINIILPRSRSLVLALLVVAGKEKLGTGPSTSILRVCSIRFTETVPVSIMKVIWMRSNVAELFVVVSWSCWQLSVSASAEFTPGQVAIVAQYLVLLPPSPSTKPLASR